MKVWASLYAMVWLVFLELLLTFAPGPPSWLLFVHAALGALILVLAAWNLGRVRGTSAPGRIKRTVRATVALAIFVAILGILLWTNLGASTPLLLGYSVRDLLLFLHVVNALAIFAQSAAVATAFDMWEEKEFERPSRPGETPPMPTSPG
ncbi:MAG TPA: hypothetical protein VEH10_06725 [Thermoplasmata archaeon]|nr:hypothetical protein [Thermoplasmata archaeon]